MTIGGGALGPLDGATSGGSSTFDGGRDAGGSLGTIGGGALGFTSPGLTSAGGGADGGGGATTGGGAAGAGSLR
ncbi:MAG: hypothetical protein KC619_13175, partial [Myxococcales bacterium]|nr:hypothetical protein [Myxococcales bacterium]